MADFAALVRRLKQQLNTNPVRSWTDSVSHNPKVFKLFADPDTDEVVVFVTAQLDPTTTDPFLKPTTQASVTATGASAALATGVAGARFRLYWASISLLAVGAVAATATINEATSAAVLLQVAATGLAAQNVTVSKSIDFGGIFQPNAGNTIQLTAAGAASPAQAELVFGAAE